MQKNRLALLYRTLLRNDKLDDDHKTKINALFLFFINCKLISAALHNLQQISKMQNKVIYSRIYMFSLLLKKFLYHFKEANE